ncbi:excitatory amino acid transporter 1-like [Nycticebus coucang]|uniref:excitatory amino acid transporter 1-like n=1 Tax=Nycticebus coucang TaxID=9470 RepID=UPI00234DC81C|nr:excitatory amino acid transporter 1-like [Nycticebus coucang]
MTKSNGEEPKMGGRMERFQQGLRKRTLLAKKKVQNITKEDVKNYLFWNAFVLLTVTAVIVGTILGFTLRPYKMSYLEIKYFAFPGELLMRMLQMLVLPLIISSLVTDEETQSQKDCTTSEVCLLASGQVYIQTHI